LKELALDDPAREEGLRKLIRSKRLLELWYQGVYARWAKALESAPPEGLSVELGAGAGFSKEWIPGMLRTDSTPYPGVDRVADALAMPWGDGELRALFMLNVLHHLPDARRFLSEACRVLKPGGLLLVTEPHIGWLGRLLYGMGHHEPMDVRAREWGAPVEHALAGANIALAWIVFQRDREQFEREFPQLELLSYEPFAPLQYWISGGLKPWSLLPAFLAPAAASLDGALGRLSPGACCFAHTLLRRRA
jgi:SAM-dependent methyltransferase